ncbi:MAG: tRNA uridine-5-carboxymethylaminomethyl(34) synthesis GTPase MnmE [Chitinophagales bacterium]|nr:tRNA uridine-5-carboxymethylaminomethyl(34) synthesis GTPase MnmE [Chitinophagales bacterium]
MNSLAHKLGGWDDTIVALATPPGIGAIGVLRVSGAKAIDIVNTLFPSKNLAAQASHTLHVGLLKKDNLLLDEVVVSLYKSPKSYTGEDVVEISCHGSPFVQEQVMQAIIDGGARMAKPGEFTQRAFLKGKMDLAQAEAVADLIASNTEASRQHAIKHMRGGFSNTLAVLRDQLIQFSALIELELDFSQEDVAFADRSQLYQLIQQLSTTTTQLIDSFKLGNVIKQGVSVAIIGKPNAGKSTLLNALLNEQRAIVSDISGTTRDTIEEVLNIDGILFRLIDTAGIRQHTSDVIETIGVERSLEKMQQADLVIYLFDAAETTQAELNTVVADLDAKSIQYLLVANKTDIQATAYQQTVLSIAAKTSKGITALKKALVDTVLDGSVSMDDTVVTNARHLDALKKLYTALNEVLQGLDDQLPGDLLALDIRRALHYLGEITGEITHEDQLDYIFSKFCIGK